MSAALAICEVNTIAYLKLLLKTSHPKTFNITFLIFIFRDISCIMSVKEI